MKKEYEISIDNVYKNEFYIMFAYLFSAVKLENTNDLDTTESDDLLEDRKFISNLHRILTGIDNCLRTIDISCLFVRRFYGKKYFESKDISATDYIKYHYDMIYYKSATLKDLYFKLINHLYQLGLNKKECNWDNINNHKSDINNHNLFKILEFNYNSLKGIIEKKRNESAHEGIISHHTLKEAELYEPLIISSSLRKYCGEPTTLIKTHYGIEIKRGKQNILKEAYAIRKITFTITKCIFCSLSDRLAETISDRLKEKYVESINKGCEIASRFLDCPYSCTSKCDFWRKNN